MIGSNKNENHGDEVRINKKIFHKIPEMTLKRVLKVPEEEGEESGAHDEHSANRVKHEITNQRDGVVTLNVR